MKARFVSRVVAAICAALVPLTFAASPVSASLGEGGQGPGIGGDGGGQGPGTGSTVSFCRDDAARGYTNPGNELRSVFFPRCFGIGPAWNYTRWICPVGFTTMRFWGDERTALRGYTISAVNYSDQDLLGCGARFAVGGSPRNTIFPYHPDDAGTVVGGYWRASATPRRFNSNGLPAHVDYGFLRGNAVRTGFVSTVSGSGAGLYGSDVPFARWGEPCTALQTSVVADLLSDTVMGAAVRSGVAGTYLQSRARGQNHAAGLVTSNLAQVSTRLKQLGDRGQLDPGAVEPGELVLDNVPCSSGLDFVPPASGAGTHYGACYAPIIAPAWGYAASSRHPDATAASYLAQAAPGYESWAWAGSSSERFEDTALTRAARAQFANHLRFTFAYGGERAAQMFAGPSIGLETAQRWADPTRYQYSHGVPDNRNRSGQSAAAAGQHWERAAQSLEAHARCTVAYHSPVTTSEETVTTPNPDGLTITVNAPRYGQVGGQVRPGTVTAVADMNVRCGGRPCGGDLRILSFDWNLTVAGTGTYSACSRSTQLGCEYRVASNRASGGQVKRNHAYELHFYNATGRNEFVRAAVSQISVRAEKRTFRSYTIRVRDPFGGFHDLQLSEEVWVPVTIPVQVVDGRTGQVVPAGGGVTFRVVNGTPG